MPKIKLTTEERKKRNCEQQRQYYLKNPEKVKERVKAWQKRNPEKVKECQRTKYRKNPEKVNVYQRKYYFKLYNKTEIETLSEPPEMTKAELIALERKIAELKKKPVEELLYVQNQINN